jgi:hypothetical protein
MKAMAQWAFLVYLAGDNNLSDAGEADLAEMRQVGSTPDGHVVVQFDRAGPQGTRRYFIQKDGLGEETTDLGETDSGSSAELLKFVDWALAEFPAERHALVLWSHGTGWAPQELEQIARQAGAQDATPQEAVECSGAATGQVFFRKTLERIYALPTWPERAICMDDGSGHALDTLQLAEILTHVQAVLGRKLDLLGMDACLMCSLEVAYQVRSACQYCVASEMPIPSRGWPYEAILKRLAAQPGLSAGALADAIVQEYIQSYATLDPLRPVSLAALDLERTAAAARALDRVAQALSGCLPGKAAEIWDAHRGSKRFTGALTDIKGLCENLANNANLPGAKDAARAALAALQPGAEGFVRALGLHGQLAADCGGVTVYLPALSPPSRFYPDLAFAKDSAWPRLLQDYHKALKSRKG